MRRKFTALVALAALWFVSVSAGMAFFPATVYAEEAARPNGHTVCLDPGTQNREAGEKADTQNLDITLSLRDALVKRGYRVILTRKDSKTLLSDKQCLDLAADGNAEILVRIDSDGQSSQQESGLTALCSPSSGTSVSSQSMQASDAFRLSFCILDACCAAAGIPNLGVQTGETLTASGTDFVPVTVLKMGFTSDETAARMADVEFRDVLTGGIADGIDFYFGIYNTDTKDTGNMKPAGNTPPASSGMKTDAKLQKLTSLLQEQLPKDNGQWSVFIGDLSSGSATSIDNRRMQAASLIKLYIMGAVYEDYEKIAGEHGADSVNNLLHSMITQSDNDAANTLTTYLGGGDPEAGMQAVTAYCAKHGYTDSSMGRLLLHSNEFGDNYTSAQDCGLFLTRIYTGSKSNSSDTPGATEMYELLKQQTRTNKIPSRLPAGVHAANKTGELGDVENDAGIIYDTEKGSDLVVCFLSENVTSPGAAQSVIGELSLFIYNYYNG